ncbi:Endonuclease/exonuclease/phosphatase [Trichophaea hybrida]|nr:Endonuclease/exonuclease/phosphatase [Trichophaea hybrida]
MQLTHLRILYVALVVFPLISAESGSFRVLTYNVAGLPGTSYILPNTHKLTLPDILSSSHPSKNTPYISARLSPYTIINPRVTPPDLHNCHRLLYTSVTHPYRTPTSGGIPFGSGLNTLSNLPYIDLVRTTWSKCSYNSGNCLTPKGFTALRVRISQYQWLDVYNLHIGAGSLPSDMAARESNIKQVLAFMDRYSPGMPVIVMGDTNMRYTTIPDSARLLPDTGFDDAWVQLWRGGVPPEKTGVPLKCPFPFPDGVGQKEMMKCEVVDKILYRHSGSALGRLWAKEIMNKHLEFLNPNNGETLSDHYPIAAIMGWDEEGSGVRLSEVVGGSGSGGWFNDVQALIKDGKGVPRLEMLTLSGKEMLVRIEVGHDVIARRMVGGSGGVEVSITLAVGEGITKVLACEGQKGKEITVFYMEVTTSAGRTLEAGTMTCECYTLKAPSGFMAAGFWGRAGDEIGKVGVVWGEQAAS